MPGSRRAASRTTARSPRGSACRDPGVRRDHRARDDPRAGARHRGARARLPPVDRGRRRAHAPRQAGGLPVTCDVGVHHVHLCDIDLGYFDSQCRLEPPLRSQRDRDALARALAEGMIDCLLRSHAGRRRRQAAAVRAGRARRHRARAAAAADAEVGPERTAVARRQPSRASLRSRRACSASRRAARLRARRRLGDLRSGRAAARGRREPASQGKNTPFLGYELAGRVRCTIVGGNVVYEA